MGQEEHAIAAICAPAAAAAAAPCVGPDALLPVALVSLPTCLGQRACTACSCESQGLLLLPLITTTTTTAITTTDPQHQVKKDASMLDAFGKGASEDIQDAKDAVYRVRVCVCVLILLMCPCWLVCVRVCWCVSV